MASGKRRLGLRKRIALRLFASLYKDTVARHTLRQLFWECTLRCNLSCRHCGSDCRVDPAHPDMPLADFLKVLDEEVTPHTAAGQVLIIFSGGEVLVRPDLELAGREVTRRGYPWGMVTNGLGLDEKRFRSLLQSGLRSISVSFDGFEEAHNHIRQNPRSWEKALGAIRMIVAYNGKLGEKNGELRIENGKLGKENNSQLTSLRSSSSSSLGKDCEQSLPSLLRRSSTLNSQLPLPVAYDVITCVTAPMVDRLDEFKEFLIGEGVGHWRIFSIFPVGRAKDDPTLTITDEQFRRVLDFIARTRKEGRIKVSYACEGFLGGYETEVRDHFYQCAAGVSVASIRVDGSISGCTSIRANFHQGNIYRDKFWDVWQNRFDKFRRRDWTREGECSACKMFRYCQGGGMHLHDDDGRLLYCHYKRL